MAAEDASKGAAITKSSMFNYAASLVAVLAGLATVVGLPMFLQSQVDASQNDDIKALQAADREQTKDNRAAAEALKAVATIVNEIDKRGTLAGREHERDREIHQP